MAFSLHALSKNLDTEQCINMKKMDERKFEEIRVCGQVLKD